MKEERHEETARNSRLYPTEKEERDYQELKERYGIKDALVVKGAGDQENDKVENHQRVKQK